MRAKSVHILVRRAGLEGHDVALPRPPDRGDAEHPPPPEVGDHPARRRVEAPGRHLQRRGSRARTSGSRRPRSSSSWAPSHARTGSGSRSCSTTRASSRPARNLGPDELTRSGWPTGRPPTLFEGSLPRVYAVGDVRSGSVSGWPRPWARGRSSSSSSTGRSTRDSRSPRHSPRSRKTTLRSPMSIVCPGLVAATSILLVPRWPVGAWTSSR